MTNGRRRFRRRALSVVATAIVATLTTGCASSASPTPATGSAFASSSGKPSSTRTVTSSPSASARVDAAPSVDPVSVSLEPIADDLEAPVGLVGSADDPDRSYLLEQAGRIVILDH